MPTTNVTDAVLKGTLICNEQGNRFTGSVEHAGEIPPGGGGGTPPPETSTAGKITGFNAANSSSFKIDGTSVSVQNGNKAWSLKQIDDYTLRFEVHSGDRWQSSGGYADPTTAERSEIQHTKNFALGEKIVIEYGLTIEPGPVNTSQWLLVGQLHQSKADGSPPFSFNMYGEKLHVVVRGPDNRENRIWSDTVTRGRKYLLKAELLFNTNGTTGTAKVWRDGVQIVNHNGSLGMGSGTSNETYYWKEGIYRNEANEAVAATFSNMNVTAG